MDFGGLVTNAVSASITGNLGVWAKGRAVKVVNAGSIAGAETGIRRWKRYQPKQCLDQRLY
jgi:GH24 family phage-related lysozyme (muramidase)